MSKIRLNLSRLTIPEKLAKAQQIITALTGNAGFPTPSPALASITSAMNELKTAADEVQVAAQTRKEKTSVQSQKEDTLDQLLTPMSRALPVLTSN